MKVEILFFDGCPSYERMLPQLREMVAASGADLVLRRVTTVGAAESEQFLGSPTVRVDGRDVDPGAAGRSDYGLKCRIYRSEELGQSTAPPEEWIRSALERSADEVEALPGRPREQPSEVVTQRPPRCARSPG